MAANSPSMKPTIAQQAFAAQPKIVTTARVIRWSTGMSRQGTAWTTSLLLHGAALFIAGWIGYSLPSSENISQLDSIWSVMAQPAELQSTPVSFIAGDSPLQGGRPLEHSVAALAEEHVQAPRVDGLRELSITPWTVEQPVWSTGRLTASAGGASSSKGDGAGQGDAIGDGEGFFGMPTQVAKRIVFVVDGSRSMNHPHESEAKTRFRKLKMELIDAVWKMTAEQQFYIIFFSKDTLPMPAQTMEWATPAAKNHYLTWVATMDAGGGPTDPRQALAMGLRLKPDIIYFLTDGEFDDVVNHKLVKIRQNRITIHTFAFGEQIGEAVLKDVARNNQGKYTFIP